MINVIVRLPTKKPKTPQNSQKIKKKEVLNLFKKINFQDHQRQSEVKFLLDGNWRKI
jgi:hypothetical protein